MAKLHFLGAARQVTGSRYVLEHNGHHIMVDCGLFQERAHLGKNWEPSPIPPQKVDCLLLTHAHLDHCGLIPKLVGDGFRSPIYTTGASVDLAEIVLRDAGGIQEEDAAHKRRRHAREGRKGSHGDKPLYTAEDAEQSLKWFKPIEYDQPFSPVDGVEVIYRDAGHILGSASLEMRIDNGGDPRTIVFSGDIGQWDRPMLRDPTLPTTADYIVMESTYGARNHPETGEVEDQLARVINETIERGGNIIIPTFAVERAQELLYHLARLIEADRIPHVLAFLDSPMAVNVTRVFRRYHELMNDEAAAILDDGSPLMRFAGLTLVSKTSESKAINRVRGSIIVMAGSGMCTAGRIKHHLVRNIDRPESTILFVGYQAHGTLGREIVDGRKRVRILGSQYDVRARIEQIHGLSAHADQAGLLRWIEKIPNAPRRVFLTHGEEDAARHLAGLIRKQRDWQVDIPAYQAAFNLD